LHRVDPQAEKSYATTSARQGGFVDLGIRRTNSSVSSHPAGK
jgi:hypothetical protein